MKRLGGFVDPVENAVRTHYGSVDFRSDNLAQPMIDGKPIRGLHDALELLLVFVEDRLCRTRRAKRVENVVNGLVESLFESFVISML